METFKKGKFEINEDSSIIFEFKGTTLRTSINNGCTGFFLYDLDNLNYHIFEVLGIGKSNRFDWVNERISQECDVEGEFPEIKTFEEFGRIIYELASMCDNVVVDGTMIAKESFKETDTTGITIKIHSTRVRVNLH